jgi:hypothetical protein
LGSYRYNCDLKSIFAALVWFHTGLFVFTIAAADPDMYDLRRLPDQHSSFFQPGQLIGHMPTRTPAGLSKQGA